jgi:membrane-associated protease RseP (regulator of RpoE activity)
MLVGMDWVTGVLGALTSPLGQLALLLVGIYLLVVVYLRRTGRWADHIMFFGPILAIRTSRVTFFDWFQRFSWPLKAYASVGVVAVVGISALFAFSLFFSLRYTLQVQPEPVGIYAPQNLFLIPGVNEYVPGTVAVWLALVITLVVHEFGHGILSRVEGIRVKAAGVLFAVVPIGAFVEPDEEELNASPRPAKVRMYGAGITNNLVVGMASFFLMIALFGMAVPTGAPMINGLYKDYPAYNASVPQGAAILTLNGTPVSSREEIAGLLSSSRPGDHTILTVEKAGSVTAHELVLSERPSGNSSAGFMGVEYYDGETISAYVKQSFNPIGILHYLVLPFDTSSTGQALRIVGFPSPNTAQYTVPFPGFWELVQLLFWSGWINLNVGIFNALPMIPFDGGYILREGIEGILSRRRLERYSPMVVGAISWLMAVTLVSLIALPYLFTIF